MRIIVLSIIALILACGFFFAGFVYGKNVKTVLPTRESTAVAKNSITPQTESVVALEAEGIKISTPRSGQKIKSPILISGEAVGSWYFEGEIPVILYNAQSEEIIRGNAKAKGDWMTDQLVPFELLLEYDQPVTSAGTLTLRKNNPSGQDALNQSIEIPVRFY